MNLGVLPARAPDGTQQFGLAKIDVFFAAHARTRTPAVKRSARIGHMPAVSYHRQILHLAIPAFLTLVAEPLFLLGDSAIVGHLGTTQLAALGLAGTIVTTIVGLCVFLAYGTTAAVARAVGAGDERRALQLGIDGMWLAVVVGVVSVLVLEVTAQWRSSRSAPARR